MPYRQIPKSIRGYTMAMDEASTKYEIASNKAISEETYMRLEALRSNYAVEVMQMNAALQQQINATLAEDSALKILRIYVSDFFQVFNLGVHRGVYAASQRTFFGLNANQESLPPLGKESEVAYYANKIIAGDPERVAAGGAVMSNPTMLEVQTKYTDFHTKHDTQSTKKDAYDNELQDVSAMTEDVRTLVIDIWDEVEFFYRHEPSEPSKRRKCREWGIVYVSRNQATISGTVTSVSPGETSLAGVNVTLIETKNTAVTAADGTYTLTTNYYGTGSLEFALEGYVTQTIEVEVPDGGTVTQDAALAPV